MAKEVKREIKFRAWNAEHKMMSEVFTLEEMQGSTANFSGSVFMQYTGLKDKNGKEIYEGDIVQNHLLRNNGKYSYQGTKKVVEYKISQNYNGFNVRDRKNLEVIGNIYENPNLLTNN